jgi:hypothetical protein
MKISGTINPSRKLYLMVYELGSYWAYLAAITGISQSI